MDLNVRIFVISHRRRIRIREIMQLHQTLINVKLKRSQRVNILDVINIVAAFYGNNEVDF